MGKRNTKKMINSRTTFADPLAGKHLPSISHERLAQETGGKLRKRVKFELSIDVSGEPEGEDFRIKSSSSSSKERRITFEETSPREGEPADFDQTGAFYSISARKFGRRSMEDRTSAQLLPHGIFYFGVFDGHNSHSIPEFLASRLHLSLLDELHGPTGVNSIESCNLYSFTLLLLSDRPRLTQMVEVLHW
eukprot:TRINITY_DN2639_c0_g1_i7.p1 TRINITY_DN2639_c0_g1~~TRINITY_DN2639_c0_g1_i7.p1  ORF type:complete len:191 (-),score=18.64 TRINITY_DN2639_c0_g1_i7:261-833(-)